MASRDRCRCLVPAVWGLALSAAAAYGYHRYATRWEEVRGWLDARPGLARVDLSRPGTTTVALPPDPGVHHHGYSFYLDPGVGAAPGRRPRGDGGGGGRPPRPTTPPRRDPCSACSRSSARSSSACS